MSEISRFYGIVISMLYKEHNPPHFHVKYGEYRVQITIKEGIVKGSLPRKALTLVFEGLDMHKGELLGNWERMKQKGNLKNIDPLA